MLPCISYETADTVILLILQLAVSCPTSFPSLLKISSFPRTASMLMLFQQIWSICGIFSSYKKNLEYISMCGKQREKKEKKTMFTYHSVIPYWLESSLSCFTSDNGKSKSFCSNMSASYSKSDIKFWDSLELRKKLSKQKRKKD